MLGKVDPATLKNMFFPDSGQRIKMLLLARDMVRIQQL